jgi:hypothetical protein
MANSYGQRALIETTMGRYKALIGPRLHACRFAAQETGPVIVHILARIARPGFIPWSVSSFQDEGHLHGDAIFRNSSIVHARFFLEHVKAGDPA